MTICLNKKRTGTCLRFAALLGLLWFCNLSCEPPERITFYDEDAVLILEFMKDEPEKYSSFLAICEAGGITSALRSFNPHGNRFTLFLPDNNAINDFIDRHAEYNSLSDLLDDKDFVRNFSRYHLVNSAYRTNEFPLGALKDTTATGDFITVSFVVNPETNESEIYLNNEARIIDGDMEAVNGMVHVINRALTPITFSSFDWLKNNPEFSIITEAFEKTGLADTLGIFRMSRTGMVIRNYYTLLAEPDSIFKKRGINSFDDLKNRFGTPELPLNDPNNLLYQFAAYHILEGNFFLDDFTTGVYNTYANFPMSIGVTVGIHINRGFRVIDTLITSNDTTLLNYIPVSLTHSNNPSRNGPVHVVTEIVELHNPRTGTITHRFRDEPMIMEARRVETTHLFDDPSSMMKLNWSGVKYLTYEFYPGVEEGGYLLLNGPFIISYEMPKIPPGTYNLNIRAHSKIPQRASIQVYLDDVRVGSTMQLTTRRLDWTWASFQVGAVEFTDYDVRTIRIEAIVPGQFAWAFVQFVPIQ